MLDRTKHDAVSKSGTARDKSIAECGVVIAGGTSGVGLAAGRAFALAGAKRIVLIGRNVDRGAKAREEILNSVPAMQVEFVSADLTEADRAEWAADAAAQLIGPVDVLVNTTVGHLVPGLFHKMAIEDIVPTLTQLLAAPLHLCRAFLPGMRERHFGVIVNIASDAGKLATPGEAVIGAGMAGIAMFSRALAMEAKRDGVRVNTITPSLIGNTGSFDRVMANEFSKKLFEKAIQAAHLGLVDADEMAELIVFLASPAAAKLTGQTISLNGGISAA